MKVFYTATYLGKDIFGKFYKIIYDQIEALGYDHVDNEVVTLNYEDYVQKMSEGNLLPVIRDSGSNPPAYSVLFASK